MSILCGLFMLDFNNYAYDKQDGIQCDCYDFLVCRKCARRSYEEMIS